MAMSGRRMRCVGAGVPVHYEQTVRPRVHRYTMSRQSGTGYTVTLWANSQPTTMACTRPGAARCNSSAQGLTRVHFSDQPDSFLSHIPVSPCLTGGLSCYHAPNASNKMCLR